MKKWPVFWFTMDPLWIQIQRFSAQGLKHWIHTTHPYYQTSDREILPSWQCLFKINTGRKRSGEKSKWTLGSKPGTKPCRFFHLTLSYMQAETHLNTMEEKDSGKEIDREGKSGELTKIRALSEGGEKKKTRKWNKNRFMMELVSRWGSPLTSEAPHSLAYPSPVKRRGHTTDLCDCQGSSARPILTLSVWSQRGPGIFESEQTPPASERWAPSQVSHQTCRFNSMCAAAEMDRLV